MSRRICAVIQDENLECSIT